MLRHRYNVSVISFTVLRGFREEQRSQRRGDDRADYHRESRGYAAEYRHELDYAGQSRGNRSDRKHALVALGRRNHYRDEHSVDRNAERQRNYLRQDVSEHRAGRRARRPHYVGKRDKPVHVRRCDLAGLNAGDCKHLVGHAERRGEPVEQIVILAELLAERKAHERVAQVDNELSQRYFEQTASGGDGAYPGDLTG